MKIGCGVVALICVVLTGTTAAASQTCETLGETEATLRDPDFDQTLNVSERVVTHCSRTSVGDEVVTEVYTRSIEGRLALSRRVRRVTTVTSDGSQTVEEVERSSRVSSSEPLRIVRRTVTTVRQSGNGTTVERQIFIRDVNGRFLLVHTESKHSSGD
jgi:hypothetical protein